MYRFLPSFILLMIPLMEALLPIYSSSSPFATAPSSPRVRETTSKVPVDDFPHAIYFSAPTSPARNSASFVPFSWEEEETRNEDFEFEFSGQVDFTRQSASAEELFESGSWIRPLKPPLRILNDSAVPAPSNISPRRHPEFSRGIFSPRSSIASPANFGFNPVKVAAMEIGRRDEEEEEEEEEEKQEVPLMHRYNRGRDRKVVPGGSVSRREMSSLPPLRLSDVIFDNSIEDVNMEVRDRDNKSDTRTTPYLTRFIWPFGNTPGYGYRRWRLRDLLLFRSVSEGTGTRNLRSKEDTVTRLDNDMASRSYGSRQRRWTEEDSFRSKEDSVGSTSSKKNRARQMQSTVSRKNSVEFHYTTNRAMSEEMKRKTFLPYRQGVLGCLGFGGGSGSGSGSIRQLAHGVGSLAREQ